MSFHLGKSHSDSLTLMLLAMNFSGVGGRGDNFL